MEPNDVAMIQANLDDQPELAKLWSEHLELEKKLDEMNQRLYLTTEEQVERKQMQKLKLAGRDRIEQILAELRGADA
ncbi:MAG: YdcH family protein [Desulfarculaceae bacterium]|nr:YdcH family protein [Desulfarculaceae bacterium]MCF8071003.1 YdcH family protein [Desulfarculaceae bacterium]MCF8100591.1 YdcH family protein [Desulfarculaceae bacterium]MCF8117723.1 YdcH family protein [Desulfarculaceae bacterium]